MPRVRQHLTRATLIASSIVAAGLTSGMLAPATADSSAPALASQVQVVQYNSRTLAEYTSKWSQPYGELDKATYGVKNGVVTVTDVPFKTGVDYSVFDHLKYIAISNQTFTAPDNGSVAFSVDITASTPGAVDGHIVHGQYGPPGSYDPTNLDARPYTATVLEGQQAGVVLNMIDFCTGQLFDWFVSGNYVFPLIERLPSTVTGNTSNPNCPGATTVALDKAYTQIIKNIRVKPGQPHTVGIVYSQSPGKSNVSYLLDGKAVASVNNVGVPLDQQGSSYTGIYPSLGPGEHLTGQIRSFSIGHGLFSLLDAFPFQYGCSAPTTSGPRDCEAASAHLSVSIPASERAFGQGAKGTFTNFLVRTTQ